MFVYISCLNTVTKAHLFSLFFCQNAANGLTVGVNISKSLHLVIEMVFTGCGFTSREQELSGCAFGVVVCKIQARKCFTLSPYH